MKKNTNELQRKINELEQRLSDLESKYKISEERRFMNDLTQRNYPLNAVPIWPF